MAMMDQPRLNTSQSQGGLSVNSRLSDTRRAKLMDLKRREDLKDQLVEKFKGRYGRGGAKDPDEMSVCSDVITREVDRFAKTADVTEANLMRLERRLQSRAQGKVADDMMSVRSVSQYSVMSRARSTTSLAGRSITGGKPAPKSYDWTRLDEYAGYLHEQDALRQKLGVGALQRKLKMDLDQQVNDKLKKKEEAVEEERRYHQNSLMELERWKQQEQARAEEQAVKIKKEKTDRDLQLEYGKQLRKEEEEKRKDEEALLVEKIVDEMEREQKRFEKKKVKVKEQMRKVFEENMEDQRKRVIAKQNAQVEEAERMKEYNRVLDEQEEQRAQELAERMEKQDALMKKLMANAEGAKKGAGDNDAQRAAAQQEEQDRHFFEAEAVKQERLKQMRLENQAYLLKQMEEKAGRGDEDKYLQHIQAQILQRDSDEYNAIEEQKVKDRRIRNVEHRKDVERQMEYKQRQSVPEMSEVEIALNRPLLHVVDATLDERDSLLATRPPPGPRPEDDE
eukprot:TRINITY_DN79613_c0_g1_i1.p1 TRINITY_DN79613_c0_g1~~TRINITY_DN79613_c0_g1_i1.p1  ORF type:complete len:507 (-),score=181.16 TRINITY_DN79613_c0_g1_i1:230-1750(-)